MNQLRLSRENSLEVSRLWSLIVVVGLTSAAAGAVLVARPSHSLKTLAVVVGIFVLLNGVAELSSSFGAAREKRPLPAIVGIVGIIVGIVLIRHPTHAASAIGLLIGIWLVVAGVGRLTGTTIVGSGLLRVCIGLLEVAVGVAVLANPRIGYTTLAVLVGIWLIVNGIAMTALAFALRSAEHNLATPRPAAHRP